MIIALLNYIENFFILWFVLACFGIKIRGQTVKFLAYVLIATFCAVLMQQVHIANNFAANSLINMGFGIVFYVVLLKFAYDKQVAAGKCFLCLAVYFIVFVIGLELLMSMFYYPLFNTCFEQHFRYLGAFKLLTTLPYRLLQIFIILMIYRKKAMK